LPKSLRLVPRRPTEPATVASTASRSERIATFIADNPDLETPFVVVDLQIVADRYHQLAAALPMADIFYAIKANPAPEILRLLVSLGSRFDVASPNEVDMCLAAGALPTQISYGNTIKKQRDIQYAYDKGVRLFAFDCDAVEVRVRPRSDDASFDLLGRRTVLDGTVRTASRHFDSYFSMNPANDFKRSPSGGGMVGSTRTSMTHGSPRESATRTAS